MRIAVALVLLLLGGAPLAGADPVPVRSPESAVHGFLVLRSEAGKVIAHGEFVQEPRGPRLRSRLVFHFTDGSLWDETVEFTQARVFRLMSYRLRQHGAAFTESYEVTFDRDTGRYDARVDDTHAEGAFDVPEDLHFAAFLPKPIVLKSAMRPEGNDRYVVGGTPGRATRYLIELEIGGVKGIVADLLGKSPPEFRYWLTTGAVPGFVKFEGPMEAKGPRRRVELAAPSWPDQR